MTTARVMTVLSVLCAGLAGCRGVKPSEEYRPPRVTTMKDKFPGADVRLGRAFHEGTGVLMDNEDGGCVEITRRIPQDIPASSDCGGFRDSNLKANIDKSSVRMAKTLDLGLTARMRLGVASFGATASFFNSVSEASDTLLVSIENSVALADEGAASVILKDKYRELALKDPARFRAVCGTAYVTSVRRGGLYRAIFSSSDKSYESSVRRQAAISGNSPSNGFSVTGADSISNAIGSSVQSMILVQSGGAPTAGALGDGKAAMVTPDQIISQARQFVCGVNKDNAGVISFDVIDYGPLVPEARLGGDPLAPEMMASTFSAAFEELRDLTLGKRVLDGIYEGVPKCDSAAKEWGDYGLRLEALKRSLQRNFVDCLGGNDVACATGGSGSVASIPKPKVMDGCMPYNCSQLDSLGFCGKCTIRSAEEILCTGFKPNSHVVITGGVSQSLSSNAGCYDFYANAFAAESNLISAASTRQFGDMHYGTVKSDGGTGARIVATGHVFGHGRFALDGYVGNDGRVTVGGKAKYVLITNCPGNGNPPVEAKTEFSSVTVCRDAMCDRTP